MTSLRTITPPAAEPVSIATVKAHLRLDGSTEDALLAIYLAGAREQGEGLARRAFITQTLEMSLDEFPRDGVLSVLRPPLQSVTSVKYTDRDNVQRTWTDYDVDIASQPGRIIFNTLPGDALRESGAITVQFVAGYGDTSPDVPSTIQNAVLALVAYWYEMRMIGDVPDGIRDAFMGERVTWF